MLDLTTLENASRFFGGYHPIKFALLLLSVSAAVWLLIFGRVGNPKTLGVSWGKINDINDLADESLFSISQTRYLAKWFDASLFKSAKETKKNANDTKHSLHSLWIGKSEDLRENAKTLKLTLQSKDEGYDLKVLVVRRMGEFVHVTHLSKVSGLPESKDPSPNFDMTLQSLKKGERLDIFLGIVADDKTHYEKVSAKSVKDLIDYQLTPG